MAIVTFWNNNTGKIGQTHSALAIASYMAIEHNYKILLISTRYKDETSMHAFGLDKESRSINLFTNNKKSMEMESGIESMSKLALSNRLVPDVIPNYTKMIFRQRLEILSGPTGADYDKVYSSCINILSSAKKYYDIVFVDLNNGLNEETTKEILNISDVVIANVEQKATNLDDITKLIDEKILSKKRTLVLINKYDSESKYTTKNVARYLGERKEALSVPYNILYTESIEDGTLAEFFLNPRIRKTENSDDRNAFFIKELKRAADAIIYKIQELQLKAW